MKVLKVFVLFHGIGFLCSSFYNFINKIPFRFLDGYYDSRLHLIEVTVSTALTIGAILMIRKKNIGHKLVSIIYKVMTLFVGSVIAYVLLYLRWNILDSLMFIFALIISMFVFYTIAYKLDHDLIPGS